MNENNPFAPAEALKTVFIAYNQAYHELILRLLSRQGLRGYTSWERAEGRGTTSGEPHIGCLCLVGRGYGLASALSRLPCSVA